MPSASAVMKRDSPLMEVTLMLRLITSLRRVLLEGRDIRSAFMLRSGVSIPLDSTIVSKGRLCELSFNLKGLIRLKT